MNRKIMFSLVIIVMALGLVIGGTFAWFTATAELKNDFTAGTVMITADERFDYDTTLAPDRVNPGDCFNKQFEITNTGNKFILLKLQLSGVWSWSQDALNYLYANLEALELDDYGTLNQGAWETAFLANVATLDPAILPEAEDVTGWIFYDDYWYYDGKIAPDEIVDFADASFEICFSGPDMGNEFQWADYTLTISFEAIQASNNASLEVWGVDSVYLPVDPESGTNWNDWGSPLN